jgi:hypothetical protein
MAIYIQLNRIGDDQSCAIYEFGSVNEIVGSVAIDKSTGEITLIQIDESSKQRTDFFLPRIKTALLKHHAKRCYPEKTWYAA